MNDFIVKKKCLEYKHTIYLANLLTFKTYMQGHTPLLNVQFPRNKTIHSFVYGKAVILKTKLTLKSTNKPFPEHASLCTH